MARASVRHSAPSAQWRCRAPPPARRPWAPAQIHEGPYKGRKRGTRRGPPMERSYLGRAANVASLGSGYRPQARTSWPNTSGTFAVSPKWYTLLGRRAPREIAEPPSPLSETLRALAWDNPVGQGHYRGAAPNSPEHQCQVVAPSSLLESGASTRLLMADTVGVPARAQNQREPHPTGHS